MHPREGPSSPAKLYGNSWTGPTRAGSFRKEPIDHRGNFLGTRGKTKEELLGKGSLSLCDIKKP